MPKNLMALLKKMVSTVVRRDNKITERHVTKNKSHTLELLPTSHCIIK